MRIIIPEESQIWTPDNPVLEPYKDIVLVVCMHGRKVTDNYECFVTEYAPVGLGMSFGITSAAYTSLQKAGPRLNDLLGFGEDVLFLTDGEPRSLYPYMVLKELNYNNHLHLFAIPPLSFESKSRKLQYETVTADLSTLDSVIILDSARILYSMDRKETLPDYFRKVRKESGELLPKVLWQIANRTWDKAYFDFHCMQYLPIEDGGDLTLKAVSETNADISGAEYTKRGSLLGEIEEALYPVPDKWAMDEVESLVPRKDGKQICNYLRGLRVRFAEANNIPFESPECPSEGPCAGTCRKCDSELAYLAEEISKIDEDRRVYPKEILKEWG